MADSRKYRHLHVRGLGVASTDFRAPGRGNSPKIPLVGNRNRHAAGLEAGLERAIVDMDEFSAEQRRNRLPKARRGIPITFEGAARSLLHVGRGRAGRGMSPLNVKRARWVDGDAADNQADQATFFVTENVLNSLRASLDTYADWDGPGQDDPDPNEEDGESDGSWQRNFKLFETATLIRAAELRDLWTDRSKAFPRTRSPIEWEVWTRSGYEESFERSLRSQEVGRTGPVQDFIDTRVRSVTATAAQMAALVKSSAAVLELRSASSFSGDRFELSSAADVERSESLASNIDGPRPDAPVVTVMDTGVEREHPLLRASLSTSGLHSAGRGWGVDDHSGHGTKMAGIVQYSDLSNNDPPERLRTRLESVVVAAPPGRQPLAARDAIRAGVQKVTGPDSNRVYCLAQTAVGDGEDGRATGTSAVLDKLSFGDGAKTRLFCVAVGNVPHSEDEPYQLADYADRNAGFGVESPAQALNALSVGAAALKELDGPQAGLVAQSGDLSPSSRTSACWPSKLDRPDILLQKPDIVMEGGNFLVDDDGVCCWPSDDHFVLTTSSERPRGSLGLAGETSAATAAAAGMCGRVLSEYRSFRHETLRGLVVHCADWTPRMLAHLDRLKSEGLPDKKALGWLMSRFGWGIPDERRVLESAANALTLVAEDTIVPYRASRSGKPSLKQNKYFRLPWPSESLSELGSTPVEMRVTLSYFIDPDPHAMSRDAMESYPSHRLRFDVRRYGESHGRAMQRVNEHADFVPSEPSASDTGWLLGRDARQRGSLHHDVWKGPAFELAQRDGISVSPIRGWWGDSPSFDKTEKQVHFSLIVSIRTPGSGGVDLWAEAAAKIPAGLLVTPAVVAST